MSESNAGSVLQPLLVAVPASVLSCLLTLWIAQPASSPPMPDSQIEINELVRKIDDALAARFDVRLRTAVGVEEAHAAERQPISEETDAEAMSRILDRMEQLLSTIGVGGGGVSSPVRRDVPTNQGQIDKLWGQSLVDWETANRSVLLMTAPEVVTTFGLPNQVGAIDGGMYWTYLPTEGLGQSEDMYVYLKFQFQGGYVTSMGAR